VADLLIPVDPASSVPLYQQIITGLEDAIADGHYDERPLPSTRRLADDLGVSRNTVLAAYDQLTGQGLIEAVPRKGLYVAPDHVVGLRAARREPRRRVSPLDWSRRLAGSRLPVENVEHVERDPAWRDYAYPFVVGQPDPTLFPVGAWERATREALRPGELAEVIQDAPGADDPALVRRICEEIAPARGIRATPEQVLITLGSQHALHLLSLVLVRPGTCVHIEDPGYVDARTIFRIAGAELVAMPIDAEGAVVGSLTGADWSTSRPATSTRPR
jgi:GntR family transcriptional regulator/MocR family aminotransferase